jgi:hypothetical protein
MSMRRAVFIIALGLASAAGPAWAQMPPGGAQQAPPCVKKFLTLRQAAEAKARVLQAAGKRKTKPTAQQACGMFNAFSAAEEKMVKYAVENETWCGIPHNVVAQMTKAHERTVKTRTRVCRVAAEERMRPHGPSLSEALGATAPNAANVTSGGGTYDTLTGSALGNQ